MGLNEIAKLVDSQHEHCVDMNLPEKHGNVGNSGWKVKMTCLASLAGMACRNEPLHATMTFLEDLKALKDSPVAHNLMCSGDEEETFLLCYNNFVTPLGVAAHELAI